MNDSRHLSLRTSPGKASGHVPGPAGRPLCLDDLPPPDTKRWVARRKAEVVTGVRAGLISVDEALRRYDLSMEEFLSWQRGFDRHGLVGLFATGAAGNRGAGRRRHS